MNTDEILGFTDVDIISELKRKTFLGLAVLDLKC